MRRLEGFRRWLADIELIRPERDTGERRELPSTGLAFASAGPCATGRCERETASQLVSPTHLDSRPLASSGRCERSESVPPRALRTRW